MADLFTIPVQNVPQRFEVELSGVTYVIENRWNPHAPCWEFDWYDADGAPLVMAVPLLAGADLTVDYPALPPGILAVLTDGNENADPTLDGLGVESKLYYVAP